ncbi:hypothetical protein V498_00706 [Pseudogymnoascus sp. VKM F-4517 (FW-2822)]|nr:hypothetical protein V498_00706 [Pseudogymnoascus sp. VKM F-4517 (FW-2822)]
MRMDPPIFRAAVRPLTTEGNHDGGATRIPPPELVIRNASEMSTGATLGRPSNRPLSMYGAGQTPQGGGSDSNGHGGAGDNAKKLPARIFQHIDDLLKAKPEVNVHAPIRRLVLDAESYSKQADTHIDFRRPDLALQDYMKASIIAIDIIPRHKEYPDLKADRGELHRLYSALQKRLYSQYTRFEEVKVAIKKNNAESGIQPGSVNVVANGISGEEQRRPPVVLKNDTQDAKTPSGGDNKSPARTKPVVHPKPNALLGKALGNHQRSQSEQINRSPNPHKEDLESRFARLRAIDTQSPARPFVKTSAVGYDRRSSLQSSKSPDKPSGPRDMPRASLGPPRPSKLAMDVLIPDMPRPPDAIYSPDRTSLDTRSFPPSRIAPRPSLSESRKPATAPAASHLTRTNPNMSADSLSNGLKGSSPRPPLDRKLFNSATVVADDLVNYMKQHRILFVDIRSRSQFDGGHIMSQSILCIEPIALTEDMSASQLEERLVVSPDNEADLFRKRQNYDFVVYYDQSSSSNLYADETSNVEEIPLRDFSKAIFEYDYNKKLKCPPKLLVGGLDSWVQLMGPGALATSTTLQAVTPPIPHHDSPMRATSTPLSLEKQYQSRPLTQDEESKWQKKLMEPSDDFAGRFPDIDTFEKRDQSNTTKASQNKSIAEHSMSDYSYVDAHEAELNSLEFREPARPALALSKRSYHGVSESVSSSASAPQKSGWGLTEVDSISPPVSASGRTGLDNFGNTCYMNSILQAFSATPWFVTYLLDGSIDRAGAPPRKKGEVSDPPQLMVRNLAFLIRHLWSGQYNFVKPQTLRNYIYRICNRGHSNSRVLFGGPNQQDAQEFLDFLLNIIEDETNPGRDRPEPAALTTAQEQQIRNEGHAAEIKFHRLRYAAAHQSPITDKLLICTMKIFKCQECGWKTTNHSDNSPYLNVSIPDGRESKLSDLLSRRFSKEGKVKEVYDDVKCDNCFAVHGRNTRRSVTEVITRLPDTLILVLVRHTADIRRNNALVTFPLDDLNMDDYYYGLSDAGKDRPGKRSATHYRCYAVVQHLGENLHSGHYITLVRDRERTSQWWEFSDRRIRTIDAALTQTSNSYIMFYQRIE